MLVNVSLRPGPHELSLETDDGRRHTGLVELDAGEVRTYDHAFPGLGSLSLVSGTWAEVRVDGGPIRQTPVRIEGLTAGRHLVHASRPGYTSREFPIVVEEGRDVKLVIDLQRER